MGTQTIKTFFFQRLISYISFKILSSDLEQGNIKIFDPTLSRWGLTKKNISLYLIFPIHEKPNR